MAADPNGLRYHHPMRIVSKLFLYAAQIAAVARVNLNQVALIDEEGHTHFNTGFERCGLGSVGSGVAFDTRLTMRNAKIGLDRHFGGENRAVGCIRYDVYDVAFLHEFHAGNLLESLLVHEDITCRIFVEILIRAVLHAHVIQLEAYLECTFEHTAVSNILQFSVHYGVTFSGFTVLKVNTSPNTAIHTDASSNFNFL